jgi:hypothetical protein
MEVCVPCTGEGGGGGGDDDPTSTSSTSFTHTTTASTTSTTSSSSSEAPTTASAEDNVYPNGDITVDEQCPADACGAGSLCAGEIEWGYLTAKDQHKGHYHDNAAAFSNHFWIFQVRCSTVLLLVVAQDSALEECDWIARLLASGHSAVGDRVHG